MQDFPTPEGLEDVLNTQSNNPEDAFHNPPGFEPEPTAPVAEPAPVVEPVPEPAPIVPPTPPVTPVQETSVEDLGYPTEGIAEGYKPLVDVFKAKGVKYTDVELVLKDAVLSGDSSKLNMDVLKSLMDEPSAILVASALGNVIDKVNAENAKAAQRIYDMAGGKDQYEAAVAYIQGTEDAKAILSGIADSNTTLQQFAVEKMMTIFKANNVQAPNLVQGNNPPVRTQETLEPLTQRQYAEELHKMRNDGTWDGASYHHPKVKSLVKRLQATASAEAARTEAARLAAEAAMEAYYRV